MFLELVFEPKMLDDLFKNMKKKPIKGVVANRLLDLSLLKAKENYLDL